MVLKFRVWDKVNERMLNIETLGLSFSPNGVLTSIYTYGPDFSNDPEVIGDDEPDLDDVTIEQFTGLKDDNGKEIYEGDILQPVFSYTKKNSGKPFEVKKGNYIYGKWIAKDVSSKGFGVDGYYFSNEMRLIGNTHTNPELLEKS